MPRKSGPGTLSGPGPSGQAPDGFRRGTDTRDLPVHQDVIQPNRIGPSFRPVPGLCLGFVSLPSRQPTRHHQSTGIVPSGPIGKTMPEPGPRASATSAGIPRLPADRPSLHRSGSGCRSAAPSRSPFRMPTPRVCGSCPLVPEIPVAAFMPTVRFEKSPADLRLAESGCMFPARPEGRQTKDHKRKQLENVSLLFVCVRTQHPGKDRHGPSPFPFRDPSFGGIRRQQAARMLPTRQWRMAEMAQGEAVA